MCYLTWRWFFGKYRDVIRPKSEENSMRRELQLTGIIVINNQQTPTIIAQSSHNPIVVKKKLVKIITHCCEKFLMFLPKISIVLYVCIYMKEIYNTTHIPSKYV